MTDKWPDPPQWQADIGPWWCGGCGGVHGWDCPYANNKEKAAADRAKGVGPFMYGPYPGGQRKPRSKA